MEAPVPIFTSAALDLLLCDLGQVMDFSEPQFPPAQCGDNDNTHLVVCED